MENEVEQDLSEFHERPKERLVSPDDYFLGEGRSQAFPFRFPERGDGIFDGILSLSYRWLDSIANPKGHFFLEHGEEPLEPYYDLLRLLYYKERIIRGEQLYLKRYNDAPRFYRVDILHAYPAGITDGKQSTERSFAHGTERSIAGAFSKAIGEFLERYFLTLYRNRDLLRGSPRTLTRRGYKTIDLRALAGFSEQQKGHSSQRRWDENGVLRWEMAVRVSTKENVLIPAQLVYWNYTHDQDEPFLREHNTNGCGGMFTKEGSILSGLYELVQRDAFLIHWLNTISPPRIDPETVPNREFQEIFKESERYGFKVHCLNTTLDTGIPSFMVVIEDPTEYYPALSIGGGCEADPEKALQRALVEAWSIYYWQRPTLPLELPKDYRPFSDPMIRQSERARIFCTPTMRAHYQFLLQGEVKSFAEFEFSHPKTFPSLKEELAAAVNQVEKLGPGYEVYAFTARHRILSRLGFFSSRVVVPALVPLYLMENNVPLGARRTYEIPKKMRLPHSGEINKWPHPFP